jgi:hypothetical protein
VEYENESTKRSELDGDSSAGTVHYPAVEQPQMYLWKWELSNREKDPLHLLLPQHQSWSRKP